MPVNAKSPFRFPFEVPIEMYFVFVKLTPLSVLNALNGNTRENAVSEFDTGVYRYLPPVWVDATISKKPTPASNRAYAKSNTNAFSPFAAKLACRLSVSDPYNNSMLTADTPEVAS